MAFTLSNAGAYYFEDRSDLARLDEINWDAVRANLWAGEWIHPSVKEGKQAEFLVERSFPWNLSAGLASGHRKYVSKWQTSYPKQVTNRASK